MEGSKKRKRLTRSVVDSEDEHTMGPSEEQPAKKVKGKVVGHEEFHGSEKCGRCQANGSARQSVCGPPSALEGVVDLLQRLHARFDNMEERMEKLEKELASIGGWVDDLVDDFKEGDTLEYPQDFVSVASADEPPGSTFTSQYTPASRGIDWSARRCPEHTHTHIAFIAGSFARYRYSLSLVLPLPWKFRLITVEEWEALLEELHDLKGATLEALYRAMRLRLDQDVAQVFHAHLASAEFNRQDPFELANIDYWHESRGEGMLERLVAASKRFRETCAEFYCLGGLQIKWALWKEYLKGGEAFLVEDSKGELDEREVVRLEMVPESVAEGVPGMGSG
ncbi:hypothetical protein IW261DRAFT_1570587 [Armillaria novae-zelandiae]|uniref:Uncharacterized protein n=1 Tax=Armillaria novae-zelandiae TaxID=153914 RepID=A0AA39NW29_9AGAR|nr:hypothetical protein IW261DRAFT_1570587 [Armillaria novae-zelandiae]